MAKKITGPPFTFKALFVNGQSLSKCPVEGFTNLTVGSTSCKLCRNHMSSGTTLRTGEPLWWEHTRTVRCKGIPKTIEKTMEQTSEVVEIIRDVSLKGLGLVLEAGDRIRVLKEADSTHSVCFLSEREFDPRLEDSLQKWVGVKKSTLSLQDFRYGDSPEAVLLRQALVDAGPINGMVFRGTVLPRGVASGLHSGSEIKLPPIASFSKTEKIAQSFATQGMVMGHSFGLGPLDKIVFRVNGLEKGIDIGSVAKSLQGQKEVLTYGKLLVKKVKEQDGLFVIDAIRRN